MLAFDIVLDGDGAWSDLAAKQAKGRLIHLGDGATIGLAAQAGGKTSGRASVLFRFDLPDGRTLVVETSLRALYNATTTIVTKHGEPFMQHPTGERAHRLELAMQALIGQLAAAKQRLGEPLELDLRESDAAWDREQVLRAALARARSALLSGEPMTADLAAHIDRALTAQKEA